MKSKAFFVTVGIFASIAHADENLLNPIGIAKVGDSVFIEAVNGYQKAPQDSLFPFIERIERAFEKSRPFYGQYYFWIGKCDLMNLENLKIEVDRRRISNMMVGCREVKGKGIFISQTKGEKRIETWERLYFEHLDSIQLNPSYINRANK